MIRFFGKKERASRVAAAQVLDKLGPHMRKAWIPAVTEGDGAASASKFSGIAWLAKDEAWPHCPNCSKPMQLFVQLDLRTLPDRPPGCPEDGRVQLFYCTTSDPMCEVDCEAFFPGSKSVVARLSRSSEQGKSLLESPVEGAFPARLITDWSSADDYPGWEELKQMGVHLTDEEAAALDELGLPLSGEKLLGWPAWVQGVEYPSCPQCETRMTLLFQIDSDGNLPYMFGDGGIGHVTQCPNHPERLAFGWACY